MNWIPEPLKCGEKRNGIRKGLGVPSSHHSGSYFLKACSIHCHVTFLQHKLLFVCNRNFTNPLLQTICYSSQGSGRNLSHAADSLFGVGFSHFALTRWIPTQSETRHWARHMDICSGIKSLEGVWLWYLAHGGTPCQMLDQQKGRLLPLAQDQQDLLLWGRRSS